MRAGAAAGAADLAGCASGGDAPTFEEGFEDGIWEWEAGAAIGPEVDIEDFDWEVDVSEEEAAVGERSPRIWNQGEYDDGVTWVVSPVPIESGSSYRIEVSGQFWSGLRDALWLAGGWREYAFEWTTPELSTDTLYLAVGTAVIWEADATHYVDDLSVRVEPR